ncbi:MAG TPA: hypothetical protein VMS31_16335 [Pyrinomonadaceae bacterium]|nr:hypothetical protein [Pyrinomonadaceae bacterium]
MKRLSLVIIIALATICSMPALSNATAASQHGHGKHGMSVKAYEEFHDVLRPLQHEALPAKDFRAIRSQSALLIKRGKTLLKLGVPTGTKAEQKDDFAKGLVKFKEALAKFKTDAKKGNDEQLTASYSAVHDTFETLADMLPRS